MSKYGQVINGSIKRGVIKSTNIENGTWYVQILNCAPIIFTVLGYVSLFIAVITSFYWCRFSRTSVIGMVCLLAVWTLRPVVICTQKFHWKNRSVNFFEIVKNVTNVTIKDAPSEVRDQFIATHMSKYGQVINGSIKRGVIKGTNIENGTRYVQILIWTFRPVVICIQSDFESPKIGSNWKNWCTI
jgi:lipid-binding SYLF domain-containing protein